MAAIRAYLPILAQSKAIEPELISGSTIPHTAPITAIIRPFTKSRTFRVKKFELFIIYGLGEESISLTWSTGTSSDMVVVPKKGFTPFKIVTSKPPTDWMIVDGPAGIQVADPIHATMIPSTTEANVTNDPMEVGVGFLSCFLPNFIAMVVRLKGK